MDDWAFGWIAAVERERDEAIARAEHAEMGDDSDRTYLDLKGARERLCRAQMHVPDHWRSDLDTAVRIIDEVGSATCPQQWSVHDQPEYGSET